MLARRTIGLVSLAIGLVAMNILYRISPPAEPSTNILGNLILGVWIFITVVSKIGMIFDQKVIRLNLMAIFMFGSMITMALVSPTPTESVLLSFGESFLMTLFVLGWPIVDFLDVLFLEDRRPVPTKTD